MQWRILTTSFPLVASWRKRPAAVLHKPRNNHTIPLKPEYSPSLYQGDIRSHPGPHPLGGQKVKRLDQLQTNDEPAYMLGLPLPIH